MIDVDYRRSGLIKHKDRYVDIYTHMYSDIFKYMYVQRERDRKREREKAVPVMEII